jgi:hypothetical protein
MFTRDELHFVPIFPELANKSATAENMASHSRMRQPRSVIRFR